MFNETTELNSTTSAFPMNDTTIDVNVKYKLYIIAPIIWSLIILFGVLGNGLIVYIILKKRLYRDSCTNCYIINVAIADLCFTVICVPVTMTAYIYKEWIFGAFFCSFENLLIFASVQAECLTLTAMAVDRYSAVLYPFKSIGFRTTKLALIINIIIWIASFTLNIPYYMYYNYGSYVDGNNTVRYCGSSFPGRMNIVITLYTVMISYVLPLMTIIFCYARMIIKIYAKSDDQKLLEKSKMFSTTAHINNAIDLKTRNSSRISFSSNKNNLIVYTSDDGYRKSLLGEREGTRQEVTPPRVSFNGALDRNFSDNESNVDNGSNGAKRREKSPANGSRPSKSYLNKNDRNNSALNYYNDTSSSNNDDDVSGSKKVEKTSFKLRPNYAKNAKGKAKKIAAHKSPNGQDATSAMRKNSSKLQHRASYTTGSSSASASASNADVIKKQKFKILVLIATVSITFALTWLPAHVIQIWRVAFNDSFPYNDFMYIVKFIAHTLTYSNCFLNPFIYVFMGSKFRRLIYSEFSYLYGLFCKCTKGASESAKFDTNLSYMNVHNFSNAGKQPQQQHAKHSYSHANGSPPISHK